MQKNTMRVVTTRNVQEEKALARKLNYLQQTQAVVNSEHDRAQTAFMKRYSALLKRKNGSLTSPAGKSVPLKTGQNVNFMVSGAGLVKRKGIENGKNVSQSVFQLTEPATQCFPPQNFDTPNHPTTSSFNGSSRGGRRLFKFSSRSIPRSAPTQRQASAGLPSIAEQSRVAQWQVHECLPQAAQASLWSSDNMLTERTIRKAWSPDLKVTSFSAESGANPRHTEVTQFPGEMTPTNPAPVRGILVNKFSSTYPLKCAGDMTELRAQLREGNRRHSMPYTSNSTENSGKPECNRKRVTFLEAQIIGHEADVNDDCKPNPMRSSGLNIVTLFDDVNLVSRDFSRCTPNFLF